MVYHNILFYCSSHHLPAQSHTARVHIAIIVDTTAFMTFYYHISSRGQLAVELLVMLHCRRNNEGHYFKRDYNNIKPHYGSIIKRSFENIIFINRTMFGNNKL